MNSLRIDTGKVKLMINEDPERVISFYPKDVDFANHLFQLVNELEQYEKEFKKKDAALKEKQKVNEYGLPDNLSEQMNLLKEACCTMRKKIDDVFGVGTSQTVFGEANNLDMFVQFFEGVLPYVEKVRDEHVSRYLKEEKNGVLQ